jgi:hypothetical protein
MGQYWDREKYDRGTGLLGYITWDNYGTLNCPTE